MSSLIHLSISFWTASSDSQPVSSAAREPRVWHEQIQGKNSTAIFWKWKHNAFLRVSRQIYEQCLIQAFTKAIKDCSSPRVAFVCVFVVCPLDFIFHITSISPLLSLLKESLPHRYWVSNSLFKSYIILHCVFSAVSHFQSNMKIEK